MSTVEYPAVVRVAALWRAVPGRQEAVREILRELATASRGEPGCLGFEVLESSAQPGSFLLLERYAGDQGRQAHVASGHFQELVLRRAVPLLTYRDVQTYQVLSTGSGKEAADERP